MVKNTDHESAKENKSKPQLIGVKDEQKKCKWCSPQQYADWTEKITKESIMRGNFEIFCDL